MRQTIFFGAAAALTPHNLNWLMACQFLAMFPFGWITLNCYTAASLNVPQKDLGVAIGLIGTFRSLGGSIGSVIFPAIFHAVSNKHVAAGIAKTAIISGVNPQRIPQIIGATIETIVGVPGAMAGLQDIPASVLDACIAAARDGYAYGFKIMWLSSIPFGVVAIACACAVRDPSKYFTNHTEIRLNEKLGGKYEDTHHEVAEK